MRSTAITAFNVGTSLGVHVPRAQHSGIKRTDLQQHDLSIAGREVV
jgi:quercetin dioxygenase-like cupin family protein